MASSSTASQATPPLFHTAAWTVGVCATCGAMARVMAVMVPQSSVALCAMCLYRAVVHETNQQMTQSGEAVVVPFPAGGGAMVPCELCPPGAYAASLSRQYRIPGTGEIAWLCVDHGRRPVPRR